MESDELEPQDDHQPAADSDGEPADKPDGEAAEKPEERMARLRAIAAQVDAQPSLLSATQRLRRRLPGDERFGDAMSTAGKRPAEVIARQVSAMRPDRQSVVQELGMAGLQVWQSLSEATGRGHGDRSMAVMFTDLVNFSSWALKAGDTQALNLLRAVGEGVEAPVLAHDGRIVKRLGDGLMATFLSAQEAVEAALDAQEAVKEIDVDGYHPKMRAGIHWGAPRKLGGDYLGVDVNVAARVADAAKADQVLVSDALLAQIDLDGLRAGRSKRLRADGAPRELQVARISRA